MSQATAKRLLGQTERRRSRRYLPPKDLCLVLRRGGLLSFLGGNYIKACINLSEGGLRVLTTRPLEAGEQLRLRFDLAGSLPPLETIVAVQYSVPSGGTPGCWESGLRFEKLPPDLRARIRTAILARAKPLDTTTRRKRGDSWGSAR